MYRILNSLLAAFFLCGQLTAAPIPFTQAVATYDQGGAYTIGSSLDGNFSNTQGWGVHGVAGQLATPQTAVFTTSAPVNAGTLSVSMFQNYGANHSIQEFRLSATSDATPSLGGNWTVLTPSFTRSTRSSFTVMGDRLRATAAGQAAPVVYTIDAPAPFQGITGLRLEVFPIQFSAVFGPTIGRADANGNFVLTEFQAEADPLINVAQYKPTIASSGLWTGFPVTNVNDGFGGTFTHPLAGSGTLGFYYEIDLGSDYVLSDIRLRGRGDGCCPERLVNYEVQLFGSDEDEGGLGEMLWTGVVRGNGAVPTSGFQDVVLPEQGTGSFHGRYLRVVNLSNVGYNPQISEIEAYGSPLPSILSFTVNGDDTIASGQQTTLAWSVINAQSVTISPTVGDVALSGETTISPATTTTYTLTATNPSGSLTATVQVGVDVTLAPPVMTEIAASQNQLNDEDGDSPDWIEIQNPNAFRLDLGGLRLSDGGVPWVFPAVTIPPNGFLLIFASGKNRTDPAGKLHTSFSLNANGETLTLSKSDGTVLQTLTFGPQVQNISYGLPVGGGAAGYFKPPTPGSANGTIGFAGLVGEVFTSVERGFFTAPFSVALQCPSTPDAQIRYTTNGAVPTAITGAVYTGPLAISTTTVFRAAAFKTTFAPSPTNTQSYIFPAAVVRQPIAPPGFPTTWTDSAGSHAADYEMDPAVVNHPTYGPQMIQGLQSIRSLSVVMDHADLWGSNGIYMNPQQRGVNWERATSIELLLPPDAQHPNGQTGFQHQCGIRVYGFGWRGHSETHKHALRLKFKDTYDGPKKLEYPLFPGWPVEKFDNIILRSQGSRSWNDFRMPDRDQTQYIRDSFARDTALAMGKQDSPATYVHLYLNGLYWGLYNVVLRPDASYGEEHEGGTEADFDALNARVGTIELIDGNLTSWNQVLSVTAAGLTNPANYEAFQNLVDLDNLIDYVIFNLWATNHDGPSNQNNFRAVRKRTAEGRWRFYFWDMEYTLWDPNENSFTSVVASGQTVWPIFTALKDNPDFQLRFADRLQKHCFNDGALVPAKAIARWEARANEIFTAVLGESARWGDARRVLPQEPPYFRDVEWAAERTRLTGTYFPQRTEIFISQAQSQNLYPTTVAPVLNQHGGQVAAGFTVSITSPALSIFYTTDGSDPRSPQGFAVGTEYTAPFSLSAVGRTTVRTRVYDGFTWSALTDATFEVGTTTPAPANIVFSEIHYHPVGGELAFVELMNIGATPVDLTNCRFTQGITYLFPNPTILLPGTRLVVTSAEYSGSLSNDGETITLTRPDGITVIRSVTYHDSGSWPSISDGGGSSMVLINPTGNPNPNLGGNWRASTLIGGNPGGSDATTFIGNATADNDRDGLSAFLEYAVGTNDNLAGPLPISCRVLNNHLVVTFPRAAAADDVIYSLEYTTGVNNPVGWQSGPTFATLTDQTLGSVTFTVNPLASANPGQFVRLRMTKRP